MPQYKIEFDINIKKFDDRLFMSEFLANVIRDHAKRAEIVGDFSKGFSNPLTSGPSPWVDEFEYEQPGAIANVKVKTTRNREKMDVTAIKANRL